MKPNGTPKTLLTLAAALLAVPLVALAQEYASVRNLDGTAQVVGINDTQPQELTLNTPLMEGDTLWTGRSGRLEVFFQDGNRLWLDYDSRLEATQFPNLDPSARRALQGRLWKGSALLDLQVDPMGSVPYSLVTPSATVFIFARGLYLVEVENVDRTRVTALEGSCDVTSSGQTVRLERMQMTYSEYGYSPTPARNAGVLPAATLLAYRDAHLPRPVRGGDSRRYLPESLGAYSSDFDQYGTWGYTGTYGYVWRPSPSYISVGWTPYRNGRWCYRPWGVTWVPFEPWGWCHSHFGRWIFSVGFGWAWVPGHLFSPAWVNWYWGDGWIGWTPWGWNDWGHHGWWSVNITNLYVTNVNHVVVDHTGPPPVPPFSPPAPPVRRGDTKNPMADGEVLGRGNTGPGAIHVLPKDLDDYRNGKLDLAGLRKGLDRAPMPPAFRPDAERGGDLQGASGARPFPGARPTSGAGPDAAPRPVHNGREDGGSGVSPRVEPTPRTQPSGRPVYEPPTVSPRTEPTPRTQPSGRPSYEPPPVSPRTEPAPRVEPAPRPAYDPPLPSARPQPSPRVEPAPRTQPDYRPSYEPPTPSPSYEPPRTVPSRPEPKPEYTPPPAPSSPPPSETDSNQVHIKRKPTSGNG